MCVVVGAGGSAQADMEWMAWGSLLDRNFLEEFLSTMMSEQMLHEVRE